MKPLDPLSHPDITNFDDPSPIERLLREAPPDEVREELARLDALELEGDAAASRGLAHGALALREGRLDDAYALCDKAANDFGDDESRDLARCETWLASVRRGPRKIYDEAIAALKSIAEASEHQTVRVVATHYRGTALRYAGRPEPTLQVLLEAFAQSDGLLVERAHVLNSLGTLYVVLGAYGAAEAVLGHAADLNHQIGDRVSEAISYGQLGSAAMAQGRLQVARSYLQKQEWFASRVGDNFGQARALVLLGDLAIDLGRPDDAIELAEQALSIAAAVTPPLRMWIAYATRSIARAKVDLGSPDAHDVLETARVLFAEIGNQLGEALVRWDLAHLAAKNGDEAHARFESAAWKLASLGLTGRVAQVLQDVCASLSEDDPSLRAIELASAAAGQCFPHLSTTQEVDLVLTRPATIAEVATRRIGGLRNLGRLAAHTLSAPGLHISIVAAAAIGSGVRCVPTRRSRGTLIGQLPGVALIAWPRDVDLSLVARDLSSLRVTLGEDTRAVLGWFEDARIVAIPFAGELGTETVGVDLTPFIASAVAAAPNKLCVLPGVDWDREAEAIALMSGFEVSQGR